MEPSSPSTAPGTGPRHPRVVTTWCSLPSRVTRPPVSWEVFADGFAGGDMSPRGANHRPVGLAVGPDGSLFISDSQVGKVWKVIYTGS